MTTKDILKSWIRGEEASTKYYSTKKGALYKHYEASYKQQIGYIVDKDAKVACFDFSELPKGHWGHNFTVRVVAEAFEIDSWQPHALTSVGIEDKNKWLVVNHNTGLFSTRADLKAFFVLKNTVLKIEKCVTAIFEYYASKRYAPVFEETERYLKLLIKELEALMLRLEVEENDVTARLGTLVEKENTNLYMFIPKTYTTKEILTYELPTNLVEELNKRANMLERKRKARYGY